jgi:hypothetical protein
LEAGLKICSESAKKHQFYSPERRSAEEELTFLAIQLGSLAPPPMVPHKPIFFLAKRPAVERCLTLTAPLELKWPLFSFSAFSVIANLQQNIPFTGFDHLLKNQWGSRL